MASDHLELETPIAWRLSALDGRKDHVDGYKPEPLVETFAVDAQDKALARKAELQRAGMVVNIVPVYVKGRKRASARRRAQFSPFGKFAKDWKMTR